MFAALDSAEKKLRSVQLLLQLLPRENRLFLRELLPLLANVVRHASTTLMTSQSLAKFVAPHVFGSRDADPSEMLGDYSKGIHMQLMTFLIDRADAVFQVRRRTSCRL